jgi:tetratricopeptide (TPR) repeat protein
MSAGRLAIARERPYDVALVPRPHVLRILFLGRATLAANLHWLRAVQYIGEPRGAERGWDRLFPLVDVITDLDPGHGYAYQVAGTVLSAVGRIEESNLILEKGMRNVPDRYILPYNRAFNAFYYDGDFTAAGRFAEIAARTPGAPEHLRQNVLAYYVKGKRSDLALEYLEHALDAAQDDESRNAISAQLETARFERAAAIVDDAIDRYRARWGIAPISPLQLVSDGLLAHLPPDPAGGEWTIGEDGRAASTRREQRIRRAARAEELGSAPSFDPGQYGTIYR